MVKNILLFLHNSVIVARIFEVVLKNMTRLLNFQQLVDQAGSLTGFHFYMLAAFADFLYVGSHLSIFSPWERAS